MTHMLIRKLVLTCALLTFAGCASRARFDVTRPALLDASQVGNTFSVQPFGGVDMRAAYRVQASLEQRISNSLNPSIRLLASGGGIVVTGDIIDYSYREDFSDSADTCSRTTSYTDANGRRRTRSESYRCTRTTRWGNASASVRFVVMVAATGQVVFDRVYQDTMRDSRSSTAGTPDPLDGRAMLERMLDSFVDEFSHVIVPWNEAVVVQFTGCGGADGCGNAFDLVRQQNWSGAEAIYTRILGPYDDATATVDRDDTDIVAETLFNRGIIRSYSGSYELGMADLGRALSLRPDEQRWRDELARIEQLAAEQSALQSQMGQAMAGAAVAPTTPATSPSVVVQQ